MDRKLTNIETGKMKVAIFLQKISMKSMKLKSNLTNDQANRQVNYRTSHQPTTEQKTKKKIFNKKKSVTDESYFSIKIQFRKSIRWWVTFVNLTYFVILSIFVAHHKTCRGGRWEWDLGFIRLALRQFSGFSRISLLNVIKNSIHSIQHKIILNSNWPSHWTT